jgi:hypothetical protein
VRSVIGQFQCWAGVSGFGTAEELKRSVTVPRTADLVILNLIPATICKQL